MTLAEALEELREKQFPHTPLGKLSAEIKEICAKEGVEPHIHDALQSIIAAVVTSLGEQQLRGEQQKMGPPHCIVGGPPDDWRLYD